MAWSEVKKINGNMNESLDALINRLYNAGITNLWSPTRASYLDHLYSQFANRGGYLDTTVSSRQSEANALARFNALSARLSTVKPSLSGEGVVDLNINDRREYVGASSVLVGKMQAPVDGVYKIVATVSGTGNSSCKANLKYTYVKENLTQYFITPVGSACYGTTGITTCGSGLSSTSTLYLLLKAGEALMFIGENAPYGNGGNLTITCGLTVSHQAC